MPFTTRTAARRSAVVTAGALGAALCLATPPPADAGTLLPSRTFLVTLAPSGPSPALAALAARALGGHILYVYAHAVRGYAVTLPAGLLPVLRHLPGVASVSADRPVHLAAASPKLTTETNPPSYGLDRIDQRTLPLSHTFSYRSTGSGVTAFVVDTGIRLTHRDLAPRAVTGYDAVTSGGTADDCNGHGTHVAGTIGGRTAGVAKAVRLVAVRVLDCSGSGSDATVVAGIDWVVAHHRAGQPAVLNMSLGGAASAPVDQAVRSATANGVTVVVAAGNDGGGLLSGLLGSNNACNGSPARVPEAITVGATDSGDALASYSDVGPCVDLFAPGTGIVSDWNTGDTATQTLSGTSMATPHVTGVAALYLSRNPHATPDQVQAALLQGATTGVISGVPSNTANRLVFSSY